MASLFDAPLFPVETKQIGHLQSMSGHGKWL